jgi:hypothetical protein
MPSLIGDIVNGVEITKNYRRQELPFSRFNSRKVIWFSIGHLDTRTNNYTLDNFNINALIDAVQTLAEIAIIGAPSLGQNWGRITIGIFEDTFNNGEDTSPDYVNHKSKSLLQVIENALEDGDVDVTQVYLYGGYSPNASGWSDSSNQREYDYKADYVNNSYLNPEDL